MLAFSYLKHSFIRHTRFSLKSFLFFGFLIILLQRFSKNLFFLSEFELYHTTVDLAENAMTFLQKNQRNYIEPWETIKDIQHADGATFALLPTSRALNNCHTSR